MTTLSSSSGSETVGMNGGSTAASSRAVASSNSTSRDESTRTPHQSALDGLKIALENYTKEQRANKLEVMIALQYANYRKHRHRLKPDMKKYWIQLHAKSIAEVTQNPLFSYERLAQAFKRLDNSERERRRRRKLKRKRKDRGGNHSFI